MSKWTLMTLSLALTFGVTACGSASDLDLSAYPTPAEEAAAETPAQEAAADAPTEEAAAEAPAEVGCGGESIPEAWCSAICFVVEAEDPAALQGHQTMSGSATVLEVMPASDSMTVDIGDTVYGDVYESASDGTGHDTWVIGHGDAQAFVAFQAEDPWMDLLRAADTVVASVGHPGPNLLMRGEDWYFTADGTGEGAIYVTM